MSTLWWGQQRKKERIQCTELECLLWVTGEDGTEEDRLGTSLMLLFIYMVSSQSLCNNNASLFLYILHTCANNWLLYINTLSCDLSIITL